MAQLQRTRVLPNERLDLPDFNRIEDFVCADMKAIQKNVLSNENFVFSGFISTGIATNTLSVALAGSSAIVGSDDGVLFIGAPSLSPLTTTSLSPGTTNYIEVYFDQDTGGADSRAFWDPTAAGGTGAEFSQIVDTFTFLKANLTVSTSNFTGDPDKVQVCEVDTNGSGVITAIRDRRNLYYRLGRGNDPTHAYPWASRTEPPNTQFTGADKDIKNQKSMNDALMDALREIKETDYWYEPSSIALVGSYRSVGLSVVSAATATSRYDWSGTALTITDDNGTPTDADPIAYLRLLDSSVNLTLTRQAGGNAISIADGEVLWIEIPAPLANVTYDGVGIVASNYRVSARGSVPLDQNTYWLAYREGTKLIIRGTGELEAGESSQVSDNVPQSLLNIIGIASEISFPVYSSDIRGTANQNIVARVGVLTDAVGDQQEDRSAYIRSVDNVQWSGSALTFTTDLIIEILNTKTGTLTEHRVLAANSPLNLANLESAWVSIDRTLATENLVLHQTSVDAIPAQNQANKDVIVLFRRIDANGNGYLHIPLHKQVLNQGDDLYLGTTGSAGSSFDPDTILVDSNGDVVTDDSDGNVLLSI